MTSTWRHPLGVGLGACVLAAVLPLGGLTGRTGAVAASAQDKTAAFDDAFEKGRQLLQRQEYFEAYRTFKRANDLAGGRSAECFLAMAQALRALKLYPNALESSDKAIELAQDDQRIEARAHNVKALVLVSLAESDRTKLTAAEAEFRLALSADPNSKVADLHFNLGMNLMRQGRDDEGIAEMKKEVDLRPNGTTADEARALMANPRRAREPYAPAFAFVSSEGKRITLESLSGRVVLLDFWGTWCAPCVKEVPSLRKLQKQHATEPSFVMLGISSDENEMKWRTFTTQNGMVWPQYWDQDRKIQFAFGVHTFPTYVLIDPEGIVRFRISGGVDRALTDAIEKQLRLLRPSPRSPADPRER